MRSKEEIISNLNDCKEYSGEFHEGFKSALLWVIDKNNKEKSPQNLPKPDAYSLLAEVREWLKQNTREPHDMHVHEQVISIDKLDDFLFKYISEHFV